MTTALAADVHDAAFCLDPTDRRRHLRQLAEQADRFSPCEVRLAVAAWSTASPAVRNAAWDELVLDVNRLADLGVGLEWREVAPGAPPNQGYSIAAEVLEQSIDEQLDVLCGAA